MRTIQQLHSGLELTLGMMILLGVFRVSRGLFSHVAVGLYLCVQQQQCAVCVLPLWAESNILKKLHLHPNKLFPLITQMNLILVLLQMLS